MYIHTNQSRVDDLCEVSNDTGVVIRVAADIIYQALTPSTGAKVVHTHCHLGYDDDDDSDDIGNYDDDDDNDDDDGDDDNNLLIIPTSGSEGHYVFKIKDQKRFNQINFCR
jgi:hypothetical protein